MDYSYNPQNPHVVQAQPMGAPGTVIVQQPSYQRPPLRDWQFGLFECFDDMKICLCGTFCGLCLACQVAGDMGESMCVPCCVPVPVLVMRAKWRGDNNIEGSLMKDCLIDSFCGACALCQLAREVNAAKTPGGNKM